LTGANNVASLALVRLDEIAFSAIGSTPIAAHRHRSDISCVSEVWYLVKFQLEGEACRRSLERGDPNGMSVTDIAFGWGFNDSSHFNRLFKAAYGVTPKAWRLGARASPES
jgi:AraC-like DNA-binding protein